jgi:hypothetical protein
MTDDDEGRLNPSELAPSRDPEARFGLPDFDEDAGDEPTASPDVRARFEPFIDAANQDPEMASRAAGPWPASDEAPKAADTASEDAITQRGLRPRPGSSDDEPPEPNA